MTPKEAEVAFQKMGLNFEEYTKIAVVQNPFRRMAELYDKILAKIDQKLINPEDISLILKAREDSNIWQKGVEPQFMKFLSTQNPNSAMACLLSIL